MPIQRVLKSFLFLTLSSSFWFAYPVCSETRPFLDAQRHSFVLSFSDAEKKETLTAGCRTKLFNASHYNILLAHLPKSETGHWELFTTPGDGILHLYAPGRVPDHVHTEKSITDGQWHEIIAVLDGSGVRLIVDGEVAAEAEAPARTDSFLSGDLVLGALVEGTFGCEGLITDAFLLSGASGHEGQLFLNDRFTEEAFAYWRFSSEDPLCGEGSEKRDGVLRPAGVVRVNPSRQIPGGMSAALQELPPLEDTAPLRHSLAQAVQSLDLAFLGEPDVSDGVFRQWSHDYDWIGKKEYPESRPGGPGEEKLRREVFDPEALPVPGESPLQAVLRRTRALLDLMGSTVDLAEEENAWNRLRQIAEKVAKQSDSQGKKGLYLAACALRRRIMLKNPLLDFDEILCVARGTFEGSVRSNPTTLDVQGGHFVTQYFGFNALPGGGLYLIRNFKGKPEIVDLVQHAVVEEGAMQGQKLEHGAFATPELSWDGETIFFAWTANPDHQWIYSKERCFHLFRINKDGSGLVQLTDGAYNDFDPCQMPDGRIAFVSERRGGYIRCFDAYLKVRSYTLFSMNARGEEMHPLSYFETSEWNPSVNNEGQLVFTRWDYVDRENCLGTRFWISGPDGSDPRAPHGNYPRPYHTFPDHEPWKGETGHERDSRFGAPLVEMGIRAIPDSSRYIFTAAPHHGSVYGTLCTLDLRHEDDGHMSQIRRITPEESFPETEMPGRRHYRYGTPWPLSEDLYLCNEWENLVLLDRFGNKELLCDLPSLPCAIDERLRIIDPVPVRPRPVPATRPVLPAKEQGDPATIAVMDVYNSDLPFPENTEIKWLRVVQNIPKPNHAMGEPMVGYERENTPRVPLGIVPVEADGSAYFEAPVAKQLIFQALDENFMAVQSMRSSAFVHPGEQITCLGCHESPHRAANRTTSPLAMRRAPSRLEPECGQVEPISYYRQIRPIFENRCVPCHIKEDAEPKDMSYEALKEEYTFWFSGAMFGDMTTAYSGVHGGSRTIPGRFGARASKIGQALLDAVHCDVVSEEDRRRIIQWLDCNSLRLGAFSREEEQVAGALVWPELDVDPENPTGVEGRGRPLRHHFWHENLWGPFPVLITDAEKECIRLLDAQSNLQWDHALADPVSAHMLPDGHILAASRQGVQELTRQHEQCWQFTVDSGDEVVSCQPLPDDRILLGVAGENRLMLLSRQGVVEKTVMLPPAESRDVRLRCCTVVQEDLYLVSFDGEKRICGLSDTGQCRLDLLCEGAPVALVGLKNGHFLVLNEQTICEYDRQGHYIWEALGPDFADIKIRAFSSVCVLENGDLLITNQGADRAEGVTLFEMTRDHRVVWQLNRRDAGDAVHCQALFDDNLWMPRPTL